MNAFSLKTITLSPTKIACNWIYNYDYNIKYKKFNFSVPGVS